MGYADARQTWTNKLKIYRSSRLDLFICGSMQIESKYINPYTHLYFYIPLKPFNHLMTNDGIYVKSILQALQKKFIGNLLSKFSIFNWRQNINLNNTIFTILSSFSHLFVSHLYRVHLIFILLKIKQILYQLFIYIINGMLKKFHFPFSLLKKIKIFSIFFYIYFSPQFSLHWPPKECEAIAPHLRYMQMLCLPASYDASCCYI